jgi:hypothetical protein
MIVALLALVLAVSPVAGAATSAVKHALFADNAAKVSGIKASRHAKANQLIALDKHAKLPASVLPRVGAGAAGATGATGPRGENGAAGLAGAAVAARVRGGGVTVPAGATISIPLTGYIWTQGAGETDLFVGSVTVTHPVGCSTGGLGIEVSAGGTSIAGVGFLTPPTNPVLGWLLEPGVATARALTVNATNNCDKNISGSVDAFSVNVVRAL